MHTLSIYHGTDHLTFTFPGAWGEVTSTQLPRMAAVLNVVQDDAVGRMALLQALTEVPDRILLHPHFLEEVIEERPVNPKRIDPNIERFAVMPALDWAFTPPRYRTSLLPSVQVGTTTYAGPTDGLDHWTLNQWSFVLSCLTNYQHTKEPPEKEQALNNWLGAAYQPAGDPWTNEHIEQHGAVLAALPAETKAAALLNYQAIHRDITELYPRVFDPFADGSTSPLGVFGTVYDVAKSGVFGDIDKTETQPLHKVLGYLEHSLHQQNEYEKEVAAKTKKPTKE